MKIVRKSNTQATQSNISDDGHGPPSATPYRTVSRRKQRDSYSYGFKRADFTNMSRQELHNLVNCQTSSGQLSLQDSAIFTWLSTHAPNEPGADVPNADPHEFINFLSFAQRGMQAAQASGNQSDARQFALSLELMQAIQGQTIGVDTLA